MKNHTESELLNNWAGTFRALRDPETIDAPLRWQEMGLQQTASGYGKRLVTRRKVMFEGKLRRIYCTQYANAGTCWFLYKGETIIVN